MRPRSLSALLALTACGRVGPVVDEAADEAVDAGGDCASVSIASASIDDGAAHVPVLAALQVSFDADVGENRIDGDSLQLFEGDSARRVPVDMMYDVAHATLTAVPSDPLEAGTTYRLELGPLGGCDPPDFAPRQFTTVQNQMLHYAELDAGGQPISCMRYVLDAERRPLRSQASSAPGPDGLYCTADDLLGSYRRYDDHDGLNRVVLVGGAGADGAWFTPDDVVDSYFTRTYGSAGVTGAVWYKAGADGTWFSADDVPYSISTSTYDEDTDLLARMTNFSGAGPDGLPFTGDDVPSNYWSYEHDAAGYRRVNHDGPGPDGAWFDEDDHIIQKDGSVVSDEHRDTLFFEEGLDGAWGTDDDRVAYAWRAEKDERGLTHTWDIFSDNGADGEALTADDVCVRSFAYVHDGDGNLVTRTSYPAGPDARCHTADDPPADYVEVFDTSG